MKKKSAATRIDLAIGLVAISLLLLIIPIFLYNKKSDSL